MVKLCSEGKAFMFCTNCGNKIDENAYICVNCGVLLKGRSEIKVVKEQKDTNVLGIVGLVFGALAMISSLILFFHDISPVGMYTEVYERVFYALDYSLFAILLASVSLILSLIGKKNVYNKCGLCLSLLSFFFIITEFVVVVIY